MKQNFQNHNKKNGGKKFSYPNNSFQEIENEENSFFSSLYLPEEKIQYPDTDDWKNLGQTVRNKVKCETKSPNNILYFSLVAAVAVFIIFVGVSVLNHAIFSPNIQTTLTTANPKEFGIIPPATELTTDEIMELETLVLQSELDALSLDLREVEVFDSEEDQTDLLDFLSDFNIDATQVI